MLPGQASLDAVLDLDGLGPGGPEEVLARLCLKALNFFVWDPEHSVRNAAGIRRDASETARELEVMVMFSLPRK